MNSQELLAILRALEVETYQACIRGDGARLKTLLHPNFREFGRSGRTYHREDTLASMPGQPQAYEILSEDFQAEELAAGLALLTYRSARLNADRTMGRHTLRASLWQLTGVGWQLRFHQGTPTDAFAIGRDG